MQRAAQFDDEGEREERMSVCSITVNVSDMPIRQALSILAFAAAHGTETIDTTIGEGVLELTLDPTTFTHADVPARVDDYQPPTPIRPRIDHDAARARAAEAT